MGALHACTLLFDCSGELLFHGGLGSLTFPVGVNSEVIVRNEIDGFHELIDRLEFSKSLCLGGERERAGLSEGLSAQSDVTEKTLKRLKKLSGQFDKMGSAPAGRLVGFLSGVVTTDPKMRGTPFY